jgi:Complex1_LYR-like
VLISFKCDAISIVVAEFRRHKEVTNPAHIIGFLSQWKMYLEELPQDADAKSFSGKKLDQTAIEKVSRS